MSSELRNNFALFSVCLVWKARGYAYSTATGLEEVGVRVMAHRVVVGKKPLGLAEGLKVYMAPHKNLYMDMPKNDWFFHGGFASKLAGFCALMSIPEFLV